MEAYHSYGILFIIGKVQKFFFIRNSRLNSDYSFAQILGQCEVESNSMSSLYTRVLDVAVWLNCEFQNGGRTHYFERRKIDTANKEDFSGRIQKNKKYILQI